MQTCVSMLSLRHMVMGGGILRELEDMRAPMSSILQFFAQQQSELQQYRQKFGPLLTPPRNIPSVSESDSGAEEEEDDDEEDEEEAEEEEEEDDDDSDDDDDDDSEDDTDDTNDDSTEDEGSDTEQE